MNSQNQISEWDPSWSETEWDQSLNRRLMELEFDLIFADAKTPAWNLAMDSVLLYEVASKRRHPLIWFWEWGDPCIVLGSYQSVRSEIDRGQAESNGFTFVRRISGGGAMMVQPGKTITYSMILPEYAVDGLSFVQSFAFLDHWCIRALRSLGIPASYRPINDIVSPAGKIAGAAQCRRKKTVLHHVTMAHDLDNELMRKILRIGRPSLSEKGIPSADKAVSPLCLYSSLSG